MRWSNKIYIIVFEGPPDRKKRERRMDGRKVRGSGHPSFLYSQLMDFVIVWFV